MHLYNGILHNHKKEGNLIFCNSMNGPRGYYARRNKSVRERQIPYHFTYMWNLMNKNKNNKKKQIHRYREQTDSCQRGRVLGLGGKGEGMKQYKLVVVEYPQRCRLQHVEYSQCRENVGMGSGGYLRQQEDYVVECMVFWLLCCTSATGGEWY